MGEGRLSCNVQSNIHSDIYHCRQLFFFLKNTSWRLAEQSLGPDAPSGRVWRRSVNDSSSALLQHQAGRSSSHLPRRV